jgi:GNAT superfamily N-acetyltransferase
VEFEIVSAVKAPADIDFTLREVNASPFIGGWTRHELEGHLEHDAIRFFYEADALAGISAWIVFGEGTWCELGPFFTFDQFRGRGLGKQVIATAIEANLAAGRRLYGVTKNDIVKGIFIKQGLQQTALLRLPRPVLLYLGRKMSPNRMIHNLTKMQAGEQIAHFIDRGLNHS